MSVKFGEKVAPLSAVLAVHAVALSALLAQEPVVLRVNSALTPISVSLITPPRVLPAQPEPVQLQPETKPVERKIATPKPLKRMIAKPVNDTPVPVAAEEPKVAEPVPALPYSEPAPEQNDLTPPEPPAPVVPPNFSAAYLDNPAPSYPMLARRIGEQGKVLLRVLVTAEGRAKTVEVKNGSGSARLDQAAVDAVAKWRFVPARRGSMPLDGWVLVPISFTLEG